MNKIRASILSLIFILVINCSNSNQNKYEESTNFSDSVISRVPLIAKDSILILYTISQYIEKGFDVFDYYKQWDIPLSSLSIKVDTIFYSQDSLKLFSFVIIKNPNIENKNPNDYFYSGADIIGFRDSKIDLWNLYYFGEFRPTGYDSYSEVADKFRKYYTKNGKFKSDYRYYWNASLHSRVPITFGYNVDDLLFWDSSIVWKKGSRIQNYYAFQTNGNVIPTDDSPIKIIPEINYPDSILSPR